MSNTDHLLNLTSVVQDTLSFGVSGLKEYLYITAISGSVSVLAFCALLMLYMFPKLAHFRVVGLLLRLSVLLGAINSLVAFMLMPPLATALTITVICVYSIFFAAFLLSFFAKGWRMVYTWYMLGFAASVKTKYLIRPTGTDDWLPYNDHEGELFTIRITNGKYWIFTTKYDLGGKFEGKASTLQNKPGDAVGLKLALDKWDGSSKTKIYYRGSATAGKSAFLFFGDTSATV